MCINKEVSLGAYLLGMGMAVMLWRRSNREDRIEDKWFALFAVAIISMQLAEYFMWQDPDCTNGGINQMASHGARYVLMLQALVNPWMFAYVTDRLKNRAVLIPLIIYTLVYVGLIIHETMTADYEWCARPVRPDNCDSGILPDNVCLAQHMNWDFLNFPAKSPTATYISILYYAGLFLPLFFLRPFSSMFIIMGSQMGLAAVAVYLFGYTGFGMAGSTWCLSVLTGIFLLYVLRPTVSGVVQR